MWRIILLAISLFLVIPGCKKEKTHKKPPSSSSLPKQQESILNDDIPQENDDLSDLLTNAEIENISKNPGRNAQAIPTNASDPGMGGYGAGYPGGFFGGSGGFPPPLPPPPPLPEPLPLPVEFIDDDWDDEEEEKEEHVIDCDGVCGNGIQEVLSQSEASCPDLIYGVSSNTTSSLYSIDETSGIGTLIANITGSVQSVRAIDFNQNGILYGVGIRSTDSASVLITINCTTGAATIIGPTNINANEAITDISFDSHGKLWAYVENATQNVGTLNIVTGNYTEVGNTSLNDIGNGLESAPFPSTSLYQAGNNNLNILSQTTGAVQSTVGPLSFPVADSPFINAMDEDFCTNISYVSFLDPSNYVGFLNLSTAVVSFLDTSSDIAPSGLDAIAVNRVYEPCDPGAASSIPLGTSCSTQCELVEINCSDGIDNNFNGLTDCADPACTGASCNDLDACTINDICTDGSCVGTLVNCQEVTGNPCINFDCIPISSSDFTCEPESFNPGSCTIDDNFCSIGVCVERTPLSASFCFEQSKTLIPIDDGGCLDTNFCTADSCDPDTGECFYETQVGTTCSISGNLCELGTCEIVGAGTPESPLDVECVITQTIQCPEPPPADQCLTASCTQATGTCGFIDQPDGTTCNDLNQCTAPDACAAGVCKGTPLTGPSCTSANLCLTGTTCNAGVCGGGTPIICNDENSCTADSCDPDDGCFHLPLNGPSGPACTPIDPNTGLPYLGICAQGYTVCDNGTPAVPPEVTCEPMIFPGDVPEDTLDTCTNGLDDNCNGLIDLADPSCALFRFVAFASSTTHDGDFAGVLASAGTAAADAQCQTLAASATPPLSGTFVALLSDSTRNMSSVLPASVAWYLPDHTTKIANNRAQLFNGLSTSLNHAIDHDESGNHITTNIFVWTGTDPSGNNTGTNCMNWSSQDDPIFGTRGDISMTNSSWVDSSPVPPCSNGLRIYCFQTGP